MDDTLARRLQDLLDRHEIMESLGRYCRGVDRMDEEFLLSAFHADARVYQGRDPITPREFADGFWPQQETRVTCQHYLTNPTVEVNGDTAYAETYVISINRQRDESTVKLIGARNLDRLERRNGEWRISERRQVAEWVLTGEGEQFARSFSRRDRDDLSYARP